MTNIVLSNLVAGIEPSPTEETSFLANTLKRQGVDVISFAQGEPDFDTPNYIKKAAIKAINEGFTKYTDVGGIIELKEAVVEKLKRQNNLEYDISGVIIGNGGKQLLYEAFATLCNPGDEVLIPTPCYVSYADQIRLTGARAVFVPTTEENEFVPCLEDVQKLWNPKVKVFVINSPCNPTGAVFPQEETRRIMDFLVENKTFVITDEVYEYLLYDGAKHISPAALDPKYKQWCIVVNSLSKTYAMTGWRIGYAAGPKEIINGMNSLQGHLTGNVNSIAQKAAAEALLGPQDDIARMVEEYAKRKDYMVNRINSIEGLSCIEPKGAFYVFANVKNLFGRTYNGNKLENDKDVANFFLKAAHVAVVPGIAFAYEGYVRFVFAKSLGTIKEGLDRIEKAIGELT
ncbi:MAG: pyridoxal phosphate-dependent aminotransferase [Acetomicrobium sp.]|jgi:aspartate aminotransferase|uniref:pyridoxal phosphate-dependent aminotransferase n=1 Tax=Acetomicrobium mobile TaxID=97477 RepID=UPI0026EF8FB3|nr:pyridoxal phosphate-dependent aminotransferase [Acetomicrobium mobile]HPT65176.1 pyridoxal phosphate-dependent aminotransferase [Acetomicrobium sp.]